MRLALLGWLGAVCLEAGTWSTPIDVAGGHVAMGGVTVEGSRPLRFLVDTGAQSSVIRPELAAELGLAPAYQVEVVSATGSRMVPGAVAGRVAAGPMAATDVEFLLYDPPAGAGRVDGVLGQGFLSAFNFLLDLKGRRMVFEPERPEGVRVRFESIAGRMAIPAAGSGERWRLILDSGASDVVLFRTSLKPSPMVTLHTMTGTGAGWAHVVPRLVVGRTLISDVPAVFAPPDGTRSEDGLLPVRWFRSVYVNNREGYVVINPVRGA